ncbi:MAG: CNNM domain-containing protein [Planctomycetota bacterium]|jgi:CBS domain containing-hemolysin-like protein
MLDYVLIAACIAFAAFYSGSETGSYCINRLRLRLRAEKGVTAARMLLRLLARPRLAIGTMLVGTNLGLYLATVLFTRRLHESGWLAPAELYSCLIMPPVLLICAEVIPKSLFQHHADTLMYRSVWPLRVSQFVFYPLAALLRWLGGLVLPDGRPGSARGGAFTPDAFRFYLSEGAAHGVLSPLQRKMAENILHLKSVRLPAVMTPLQEVVMIAEDASPGELVELLRGHRYSRIPLYRGSPERIVGVINIIDVASNHEPSAPPHALARGVLTFEEGASVADALWGLRQARQQFGVVVDPQARAVGIITVKDLVEEIVGELEAW